MAQCVHTFIHGGCFLFWSGGVSENPSSADFFRKSSAFFRAHFRTRFPCKFRNVFFWAVNVCLGRLIYHWRVSLRKPPRSF